MNEAGCGAAIRKLASTVQRDQIFFTSKVPGRSLSYENAKAQVDKTLKETGLDYVDLMLLHAPVSIYPPSPLRRRGRARPTKLSIRQKKKEEKVISVSNFRVLFNPVSTAVPPRARPPGAVWSSASKRARSAASACPTTACTTSTS